MERLVFGNRDKILLLGLKESPLLVTRKLIRPGAFWGGRVNTRRVTWAWGEYYLGGAHNCFLATSQGRYCLQKEKRALG